MMRIPKTVALAVCIALGLGAPRASHADDAVAEAVFDEGLRLMKEGKVDEACAAFDRAVELAGGNAVGGLLLLADCREKQGRPATAWATYRRALAAAKTQNDSRAQRATDAIARLEPTLPKLTIEVESSLRDKNVVVERAGAPLPREAWGVALPVDPGVVGITAVLPDKDTFATQIVIPNEPKVTSITIEPWGCAAAGAKCETPPGKDPTPIRTPEPDAAPLGAVGIAGIVMGAVGLGGLGAGIGMGFAADAAYQEAIEDGENDCDAGFCNQRGKDAVADARFLGDAGTAVGAIGAVLAGAGVAMIIIDVATKPSPDKPPITQTPPAARTRFIVSPTSLAFVTDLD